MLFDFPKDKTLLADRVTLLVEQIRLQPLNLRIHLFLRITNLAEATDIKTIFFNELNSLRLIHLNFTALILFRVLITAILKCLIALLRLVVKTNSN